MSQQILSELNQLRLAFEALAARVEKLERQADEPSYERKTLSLGRQKAAPNGSQ